MRTIQTLLGHSDLKTTEIYTHVAKGVGALGVKSPLDRMGLAAACRISLVSSITKRTPEAEKV